jgi:integrase
LGHAVGRACQRAEIEHWHPHQLRHAAATELRREIGIEAARVVLGHRSPGMAELYAEADRTAAAAHMARLG